MQQKHHLYLSLYFQGLPTRGNVFTLTFVVFILFFGALAFAGFVQPAEAFAKASGVSVRHDVEYAKKVRDDEDPSRTLSTWASLISNTRSSANIPISDHGKFSSIFTAPAADPYSVTIDRFRLSDLDLRDPHFFTDFLGCRDITDTQVAGFSINNEIQTDIQTDGTDADSFLDSSYVLEFTPFDPTQATMPFVFGTAECTSPMATTVCGVVNGQVVETTATPSATVDCLTPFAGTLRPYAPALATAAAPCFGANLGIVTLNIGGIPLTLRDTTIGATFAGSPTTTFTNGVIRGFVSETDANSTIIPASQPLIGGKALSALLPGGDPTGPDQNCAAHDDKDINNGVTGWWFYFNFPAARLMDATAADASISGRIMTAYGRAISGAIVVIQDGNGGKKSYLTNTFGYYSFPGLRVGESYVVSVSSRRYQFAIPTQIVSLQDDVTDMNFIASP